MRPNSRPVCHWIGVVFSCLHRFHGCPYFADVLRILCGWVRFVSIRQETTSSVSDKLDKHFAGPGLKVTKPLRFRNCKSQTCFWVWHSVFTQIIKIYQNLIATHRCVHVSIPCDIVGRSSKRPPWTSDHYTFKIGDSLRFGIGDLYFSDNFGRDSVEWRQRSMPQNGSLGCTGVMFSQWIVVSDHNPTGQMRQVPSTVAGWTPNRDLAWILLKLLVVGHEWHMAHISQWGLQVPTATATVQHSDAQMGVLWGCAHAPETTAGSGATEGIERVWRCRFQHQMTPCTSY